MNLSRQQMLALGISGALVYVSMSVIKRGRVGVADRLDLDQT